MIVNIPHDGDIIPIEYADFIGDPTYMGDYGATFLFAYDWATVLRFPISRLICDVERFEDRDKEPMERIGMGVCYTRNANLEPMREVPAGQREEIIERFYHPYHEEMCQLVDKEVERHGVCLIIDGHTYHTTKRPYETDPVRPQICVGYDESVAIGQFASSYLSDFGYDVIENRPFSGAIRPLDRIGDKRVQSVMLEVRQDQIRAKTRRDLEGLAVALSNMVYGDSSLSI